MDFSLKYSQGLKSHRNFQGIPHTMLFIQQEYKVYSYFHQRWTDSRLAGKLNRTLTIKTADIENIWIPDPYCYNARESNMMMPDAEIHSSVSIQPSGDVFYSKGYVQLFVCTADCLLAI